MTTANIIANITENDKYFPDITKIIDSITKQNNSFSNYKSSYDTLNSSFDDCKKKIYNLFSSPDLLLNFHPKKVKQEEYANKIKEYFDYLLCIYPFLYYSIKHNFPEKYRKTLITLYKSVIFILELLTLDDFSNRTKLKLNKMEYNNLFPKERAKHYQNGGHIYKAQYYKYKQKYLKLKQQLSKT